MAANDYLKVASAQLQRAATFLKTQARDLLSERDRTTSQKTSEISRAQLELKTTQAQIPNASDSNQKVHLEQHTRELQKEIERKRAEVKQVNNQLSDAAKAKEQAAQRVIDEARSLESQAGSAEMTS